MLGELQKIIAAVPPTQQVAARPAATSGPMATALTRGTGGVSTYPAVQGSTGRSDGTYPSQMGAVAPNPTQVGHDWTKVRDGSGGMTLYRDPQGREWIVGPGGSYIEPNSMATIQSGGQVTGSPASTSGPVADGGYSPRWLDFGLQMEGAGGLKVPTFAASDFGWGPYKDAATAKKALDEYHAMQAYSMQGDYSSLPAPGAPQYLQIEPASGFGDYNLNPGGPIVPYFGYQGEAGKYSWLTEPGKGLYRPDSVAVIADPNNPNAFALKVKTADKQGTIIPYTLQGNEWVPQRQGIQNVRWDTNNEFKTIAPALAVLGAAGLGALLAPGSAGAAGAAPSAAAPGATAADIANMANVGMGAGGSVAPAAAAGGGTAASAADIAAMANVGMGPGGAVVPVAGSTAGGTMNALSSFLSPNVLNIGSNLLSGYLQDRSARRAADAQMAATQAAIDESRRQFDITRSDMEPWRLAGTDSINQLRTALAPGAEFNRSYTWGDIEGDPIFAQTYQTGLTEGTNALRRQLSAAGQRNSGAALKALTRFASDYTNKTGTDALNRWRTGIGDRFNRLSGVAGTGQQTVGQLGQLGANYATNYGNLITSAGNARGASEIARGNAWGGALTNAFNTWQQNRLMDRLLPIG